MSPPPAPALHGHDDRAANTVARVWPVARRLGVTRLTALTNLDRIGIPVAAAVRPDAALVVSTAGKGLTRGQAMLSALMEAVEQAVAELAADHAPIRWASARRVAAEGGPRIGAWCPRPDVPLDVDVPLPWVDAKVLRNQSTVPVPAELVLAPCPPPWRTGLFGSTTTGLASGTSRAQAVVHGLCEVLERDTTSLLAVHDTSLLLDPATFPEPVAGLHRAIVSAGLRVWLRRHAAVGGHYMTCLIDDPDHAHPLYCNGGYAMRPDPVAAAVAAITEAAQSRMTYIHGSRDDLTADYARFARMSPDEVTDYREQLLDRYSRAPATPFPKAPAPAPNQPLLDVLLDAADTEGLGPVALYDFPSPANGIHVVRVVVAGAEHFTSDTRRVGSRLAARVGRARMEGQP